MTNESDPTVPNNATDDADGAATDEIPEDVEATIAQTRQRVVQIPAETIVTQHVAGLGELGAIHLTSTPPNLKSASLAIDAMAAVIEAVGDRLGDNTKELQEAVNNMRVAYVTVKSENQDQEN